MKAYTCEIEIYQIPKDMMIDTFNLAIFSKIKKMMRQLYGSINVNTWTRFEEKLRDGNFDEDIEKLTKKIFLIE